MNPSDFDRRFTFQKPTYASDGRGSMIPTYVDACTVWGRKTVHRSDEAVQAMATTGVTVSTIRIYYRPDIGVSWRVKEKNAYMNIIGVVEKWDEGQKYLDVIVKEVG